ncbi:MAG: hypothetical protein VR65_25905 [Desulfobulbaceae bacterium BRH_c16a]|nr:MAG: hypothetical protein VR65_25905 [Desulfobulbaceae bacterium BRH_c16a]
MKPLAYRAKTFEIFPYHIPAGASTTALTAAEIIAQLTSGPEEAPTANLLQFYSHYICFAFMLIQICLVLILRKPIHKGNGHNDNDDEKEACDDAEMNKV